MLARSGDKWSSQAPLARPQVLAGRIMDFLAFFSNDQGAGVVPIQALDPPHAIDIAKALYPEARLAVVPVESVQGISRQELLLEWIAGVGLAQE